MKNWKAAVVVLAGFAQVALATPERQGTPMPNEQQGSMNDPTTNMQEPSMKTKKDAGTGGSGTGSSGAVMAPGENTYDPSGNEMNKHADAGTKP